MSPARSFDLNIGYDEVGSDNDSGGSESQDNIVAISDDDNVGGSSTSGNHVDLAADEGDGVEAPLSEGVQPSINPPHVGLVSEHEEEFFDLIHGYSKQKGFQTRIQSSELLTDDEIGTDVKGMKEKYKMVRIECSKGGKFKSKSRDPSKGSTSAIIGCKFRVKAVHEQAGLWRITIVVLEHNHECVPKYSKFLPKYRFITEGNKKRILDMDRAGVLIAKNYTSFVVERGNHDNVDFNERDIRNLVAKARREDMDKDDFIAMRNHFEEMCSSNSNFFYSCDVDENNRLNNVFWADGRSQAAYVEFGDVISFDTPVSSYIESRPATLSMSMFLRENIIP